jgi:hypothetical protein
LDEPAEKLFYYLALRRKARVKREIVNRVYSLKGMSGFLESDVSRELFIKERRVIKSW